MAPTSAPVPTSTQAPTKAPINVPNAFFEKFTSTSDQTPFGRSSGVLISSEDEVMLFGGVNKNTQLDDSWTYSMKNKNWTVCSRIFIIPFLKYSKKKVL